MDPEGQLVYGPLELRLGPLRQSEIDFERRKCSRIWQVNEDGEREYVADPTELAARWVVRAMVPEDRERYLENKRMWQRGSSGMA